MDLYRRIFIAASLAVAASARRKLALAADVAGTPRINTVTKETSDLVNKVKNALLAMQRYSWEQGMAGQAMLEWGNQEQAIQIAKASLINVTSMLPPKARPFLY